MTGPVITSVLGNRYDTQYLLRGEVPVEGFELEFQDVGKHPWAAFNRMVNDLPWDLSEQAFSHYLIARDQGRPLTAVPAFPSRFFPQMGAVVRKAANITTPKDLEGKRVGVMGFGYNPAVWLRGILEHHYGVDTSAIVWVEDEEDRFLGGLDYPHAERYRVERVPGFDSLLTKGTEPGMISALESGEVDAFFAPAGGPPLSAGTAHLFPDREAAVREWYQASGVFPINTLVTLRQETVERHPQLPARLMAALEAARARYHAEMPDADHMGMRVDFLRELGVFPDTYGIDANRNAVETMVDYCLEQGVIRRRYTPEELFVA